MKTNKYYTTQYASNHQGENKEKQQYIQKIFRTQQILQTEYQLTLYYIFATK